MGNIISKLNLNKTPRLVENNSLIFAKNIKLLVDGTIGRDDGISKLSIDIEDENNQTTFTKQFDFIQILKILIDNKVTNLVQEQGAVTSRLNDLLENDDVTESNAITINQNIVNTLQTKIDKYSLVSANTNKYFVKGVVPNNNEFYIFCVSNDLPNYPNSFILKYVEDTNEVSLLDVTWNYSGGSIKGYCEKNLIGQTILNIAEYKDDSTLIPFKSINTETCREDYDESIYTQAPKIPFTNLKLTAYYNKKIKNGTYQFFVRYKISDNFYTKWYVASNILQIANTVKEATVFGLVKYFKESLDCDKSFVFEVEHLNLDVLNSLNYTSFQLGFIVTTDETATYGKIWKSFSFNTRIIYFDGNPEQLEDIEFSELLEPIYNLYNVKNIASFKNKLYISNYVESNINPNFQSYADNINIKLKAKTLSYDEQDLNYESLYRILYVFENNGTIIEYLANPYLENYNDILYSKMYKEDGNPAAIDIYLGELVRQAIINICDYIFGYMARGYNPSVIPNYKDETGLISYSAKYKQRSSTQNFDDRTIMLTIGSHSGIGYSGETVYDSLIDNFQELELNNGCFNVYRVITNNDGSLYVKYDSSHNGDYVFGLLYFTLWAKDDNTHNYIYRFDISISSLGNVTYLSKSNTILQTLIPFQSYKFYVHYVNEYGEETNGYLIDEVTVDDTFIEDNISAITNHDIIYPIFENITFPEKYPYCYITFVKSKTKTYELFNISNKSYGNKYKAVNLEANIRLINLIDNVPTLLYDIDANGIRSFMEVANYASSNDGVHVRELGGYGMLLYNNDLDITSTSVIGFIKQDYEINEDNIKLHRCTPYIKKESNEALTYDSSDLFLDGYICAIHAPIADKIYDYYYFSANDVYKKIGDGFDELSLEEYNYDGTNEILYNRSSDRLFLIYSNYNLNYVSLGVDIATKIISKTYGSNNENKKTFIYNGINSTELSDLYKLNTMFIDYIERTYVKYYDKAIVKFDNTIRSSIVIGDESTSEIYYFRPEDYYNVPTNKGIITNLVSIGNYIIVHTKDSLFNFSGNNSLTAQDGEVKPVETEVFDTGIQEVFGSNLGFAGLEKNTHSIVIQDGYVFYDSSVRKIYIYFGQGQINCISDNIEKLLNYCNPVDVFLANDFCNNNRFFICIKYLSSNVYKYVTLSYNIKTKSFISVHDFYYDLAFNTKRNCYFVRDNGIYIIDKTTIGYNDLLNTDELYPSVTFANVINNVRGAIVDIIVNDDIEIVKTLNAVHWIISKILQFVPVRFIDGEQPSEKDLMAEESLDRTYAGDKMLIYTDSTYTPIIDISKVSNDYSIYSSDSYKYPRYNQGRWTLNYFRDIKNIGEDEIPPYSADNQSLIEGKYFVIRFILDSNNDFKLETLGLQYNNKV